MISLICVSNDKEVLNECLIKSLSLQKGEFELIVIDNTESVWHSAATALNEGARKAKGDFLIFVHQDFIFESNNWLLDFVKFSNELESFGAAGVAGAAKNQGIVSNITHNWPIPVRVGYFEISKPIKVQTLDECLISIPRTVFSRFPFDEGTCDNWHLYGVDLSLTVLENGMNVYVLPLPGYHKSNGSSYTSGNYDRSLKLVLKKHRKSFRVIYTTCGNWSTGHSIIMQKVLNGTISLLMKLKS